MMPQEETKEELEVKYNTEDSQQAAAAPVITQQVHPLNNTHLPATHLWQHIILSPSIVELPNTEPSAEENSDPEPSSEGAVVPARRFALGEGFGLNDFINFGKVSKFFNALVRESIGIQNQMRVLASTFPRFIPLQQAYLASQRVINRIANRQLTLNRAVVGIAQDRLPTQDTAYYSNNGVQTNVSLATKNAAVERGVSPSEIRFDWWSNAHVEALDAGVPFEEIQSLNSYQVQAILATRNVDNVTPLARKDVISGNLSATHIQALKEGKSFESIKKLSELQLKAFLKGFSEDAVLKLHAVQLSLLLRGLTMKELTSLHFLEWMKRVRHTHIDQVENLITRLLDCGYTLEEIMELSSNQLAGMDAGLSVEQVKNPIFIDFCKKDSTDYGGIRHDISAALKAGYSLEQIKELDIFQLSALAKGNTLEYVKNPAFLALFKNFGKQYNWLRVKLLRQDVPIEEIASLTALQFRGLNSENMDVTLAQVRDPKFSESALSAMEKGHNFETVIDLQPWQHHLLAGGAPLAEVLKPNPGMTPLHNVAVLLGISYNAIKDLNGNTLMHFLATPYSALPQVQQPLPSRVESKDDRFLTPVVVHTSDSSSSSSPSSSYYAPGGSSSSSSSASSSFDCRGRSSSSSSTSSRAPTPGSTLTQYEQTTARRSTSPEPEERCYSPDEENKPKVVRLPSPERAS